MCSTDLLKRVSIQQSLQLVQLSWFQHCGMESTQCTSPASSTFSFAQKSLKTFIRLVTNFSKWIPSFYVRKALSYVGCMVNCAFFCIMWRLRTPSAVYVFGSSMYWHPPLTLVAALTLSRLTGLAKPQKPVNTKAKTK